MTLCLVPPLPMRLKHKLTGASLAVLTMLTSHGALAQANLLANQLAGRPNNANSDAQSVYVEAQDIATDDSGNEITASGGVVAVSGERQVASDRLIFNRAGHNIQAQGHVILRQEAAGVTFADSISVDDALESGTILGMSARINDGGTLAASRAQRVNLSHTVMDNVVYTACPICADGTPPTWAIKAAHADQDRGIGLVQYQNVIVEVAGVPVLYLPYLSHPDQSATRRSGLLPAFPATDSRLGLHTSIPYLWVIDPHSDLTISPLISQNVAPVLQFEYRRLFHSGLLSMRGSGTYERLFGTDGQTFGDRAFRGHLFANGTFHLNPEWVWGFGVEQASDDTYFMRYSLNGEGETSGIARARSGSLLSQIYAQAQNDHRFMRVYAAGFRDLTTGPDTEYPIVAPAFEYHRQYNFGPFGGKIEHFASGAVLSRADQNLTSISLSSGIRYHAEKIFSNGLVLNPYAMGRLDGFSYDRAGSGADEKFGRAVGLLGARLSWPLASGAISGLTIAPEINATWASYPPNQDRILKEDSLGFELAGRAITRNEGSTGIDLWEPGARISLGISSDYHMNNGTRLKGFVGLRWRDYVDPNFDRISNLDRSTSDIVAQVGVDIPNFGNIGSEVRFDPRSGEWARTETWATIQYGGVSADIRHLNQSANIYGPQNAGQEIEAAVRGRVSQHWQLFAAGIADLGHDQTLVSRYGAIFQDDCTELRIYFERTNFRTRFIEPSSGVRVELALRTFGILAPDLLSRYH